MEWNAGGGVGGDVTTTTTTTRNTQNDRFSRYCLFTQQGSM
jgi:hypothetical protein